MQSWTRIKEIVADAVEMDAAERREFLDSADIPPEMREEIESLLAQAPQAAGFMSIPAGSFLPEVAATEARQRIGAFEIVRELGVGGMGTVYLAERRDGNFSQQAAIKLLRRELSGARVRASFEREIAIQSRLVHPSIARILDTGSADDGIPYIVMEYVDGLPIDAYCDVNGLDLNARLRLVAKVCDAVGFLHRNLIIHRDLKPSNIIVTGDGTPKLLDFGISKFIDEGDQSALTMFHTMTPEYASPEQINGEKLSTATDIYSLGIVLFRILTGASPYRPAPASRAELFRAITEDGPRPPSNVTVPNAPVRGTQLKGDIDNIVLKSLAKRPEDRYKSAEALAADLFRFIERQPVEARKPSISYRLSRFLQRNRIAATSGLLIFTALVAGIAMSVWQRNLARAQAGIAASEAERAVAEQAKAEKVTRFMTKIIGYANPKWYGEGARFGSEARVIDAIIDLSGKIDVEFPNEPEVAAELHHLFAVSVMTNAGGLTPEERRERGLYHARRALELRRQFYGENHELVAKDMVHLYWLGGVPNEEMPRYLMKAIRMMRDTNPLNRNFPFMIEDYVVRLMIPGKYEARSEEYLLAAESPGETKYQVGERLARYAVTAARHHFPPDSATVAIFECQIAYSLAMQGRWVEFDEVLPRCRPLIRDADLPDSTPSSRMYYDLIRQVQDERTTAASGQTK